MIGWVYIAVNNSLPGQCKIGYSAFDPRERLLELQSTGVPTPFLLAYAAMVEDAEVFEREVHLRLAAHRTASNREFFSVLPENAIKSLLDVAEANEFELLYVMTGECIDPQTFETWESRSARIQAAIGEFQTNLERLRDLLVQTQIELRATNYSKSGLEETYALERQIALLSHRITTENLPEESEALQKWLDRTRNEISYLDSRYRCLCFGR